MQVPVKKWRFFQGYALALLFLFLLLLEFQSPRFFCWDDNATQFCGYYRYNYEAIFHHKTFPWMVWTQYAGEPNLTQSQSGVFYLPAYLATGLSWACFKNPFWSVDFLVIAHLLFGAWGMMRFVKDERLPDSWAAAAGLLYATTPFFLLISRSWIFVSSSMAFTPWLFLFAKRMIEQNTWSNLPLYLLLKSTFFFQGYTHVWINLSFIEGLYFLWLWFHARQKNADSLWPAMWRYITAQLLHFIIILPQLWVNLISVQDSPYRGAKLRLDQLIQFHLDPSDGFLAQLGIFLPERYFNSSSAVLFSGGTVITLYLFYVAWKNKTRPDFSLKTAALFWVLLLLLSTSAYAALTLFPPFNILRWPIKFMMITPFFAVQTYLLCLRQTALFSAQSPWPLRLLLASLIAQVSVIFNPAYQAPFSTLRFKSDENFQVKWNYRGDRVLPIESETNPLDIADPAYLSYNYGTWAGIPTLGGYDQLVSKLNSRVALGMQITGSLPVESVVKHLSHLNQWSVRYLTISPKNRDLFRLSDELHFEEIYRSDSLVVFENHGAFPLASFSENPKESLPVTFSPASMMIKTDSKRGELIVRTAATPHLQYRCNPSNATHWREIIRSGDAPIKIQLSEPSESVEIRYLPSRAYLAICFISALISVILLTITLQQFLKKARS